MNRIENIIKFVHIIWKGSHMNTLVKYYVYRKTKSDNKYWFQNFAAFWMLYFAFWVNPRRLNFMRPSFGTMCSIRILCRRFGYSVSSYLYVQTFRKLCFILCADFRKFCFIRTMCRRFGNSVSSYLYVQTFRKFCFILTLFGRRFGNSVSS